LVIVFKHVILTYNGVQICALLVWKSCIIRVNLHPILLAYTIEDGAQIILRIQKKLYEEFMHTKEFPMMQYLDEEAGPSCAPLSNIFGSTSNSNADRVQAAKEFIENSAGAENLEDFSAYFEGYTLIYLPRNTEEVTKDTQFTFLKENQSRAIIGSILNVSV
ncbi:hypothetical protein ACJX0J_035522, partial [Zea mays]